MNLADLSLGGVQREDGKAGVLVGSPAAGVLAALILGRRNRVYGSA